MLIIDSHVHFYEKFNEIEFYNSIRRNCKKISAENNCKTFQSVICLTESSGVNYFSKIQKRAFDSNWLGGFHFTATQNKNALIVTDKANYKIFCIAGRQIVTRENLEVLALGMVENFSDKQPIEFVIRAVIEKGCIPIIPWGFGKWSGGRKKIVEEIVLNNSYHPFFLGDNGNRPSFMNISPVFDLGYRKTVGNIQGSDPLPFKGEEKKAGSFGVLINKEISEEAPFDNLYEILCDRNLTVELYGSLESPARFVRHQLAMQIIKRLRR